MSIVYFNNIKELAIQNKNYRHVVYTDDGKIQLVFMCITVEDKDIPWEIHQNVTQMIRVEDGEGKAIYKKNGEKYYCKLNKNSLIIIESNTEHRIINTSKSQNLIITSIYSPPEHPRNRIDVRK